MLRSPRIQPSAPTSNAPRTLATSPNSTSAPSFSRYTEPCSFIPHRTSTPSANTSLNHCLLSLNSGADGISYFGCRGRKIEEREPPGVVRARQDRRALNACEHGWWEAVLERRPRPVDADGLSQAAALEAGVALEDEKEDAGLLEGKCARVRPTIPDRL